jgi:uncharacterized protein YjbI with pentapeptide repeats
MTKATEQFTIPKRWSWLAAITVSIECDPLAPMGVKMGLAVRVAYETGADLTGADLTGADLTGAALTGAVLRGADLRDAVLRDADLTGAALTGADLTGAVLRGAVLRGADLRDADLTGAVLRGAVLRGADLRDADLTGADLTGAALTGADLRGAVLRDAVLRGADLRGEKIERLLASANRLDGYAFYGFQLQAGGVKIAAGCRCFTCAEFRAHVAVAYPDTDKARETLRIIDFIEGRAADLGVALEPVVEQAA